MSIFRENAEYLEEIIDNMLAEKQLVVNKLGELATDIEEELTKDYGDEDGDFDIDGWDTNSDGEVIAFDIGYRNACLNAIRLLKEQNFVGDGEGRLKGEN
tara:strand:- start:5284 stop:5583 length:300 start_codon:yes stop_codon:yes gene_type:complete